MRSSDRSTTGSSRVARIGDRRAAHLRQQLADAPPMTRFDVLDSAVRLTITRRSATGRVYSVLLRFADTATVAESPALAPGLYDVRMEGGQVLLAVNESRELLPRRPTVRPGAVRGGAVAGSAPSARSFGWLYVVVVLLLCTEWLLRRRAGLR